MKGLAVTVLAVLVLAGCVTQKASVSNVKAFTFDDTNDTVANQQHCIDLCMERQRQSAAEFRPYIDRGIYRCDYKPVTCNGKTCLCETY